MKTLVLILILGASSFLNARELEGAKFSDTVNVGRANLTLNGVGMRTATLFKVKVYAAGLYLPQPATDEKVVAEMQWPMQIQMEFFRNVDVKDIREAWDKSFKDNCDTKCEDLKPGMNQLLAVMPSVKKQDRMSYTFQESGVEVTLNGKKLGDISGSAFSRFLLSTWLGKNPPTEALKKGLLGLTP